MKYLWKIGGEAGFGIMTSGLSISKISTRSGYHAYDYAEYPSLIRGGHNTYEVVISDEEVHATQQHIDMLVCLNKDTFTFHTHRLNETSIVIYDEQTFVPETTAVKVQVPFKKILEELKGPTLMTNTTALGASLALLDGDMQVLFTMIEEQFGRKGEEVVNYNKQFAQKGYDYVKQNYPTLVKQVLTKKQNGEKLVLSGNESFSLAAAVADCRLYSAYPMTPTSNVLSILAAWQNTTGMVVRHAEDEIAVVNTALGASHAGVRAAVGTSGGGFALMVEAISYAGVAEIPIVIFLGQRPGPATGMPTWTEQGDLLFAVHAGHGEFPKIVLAPGDVYEMAEMALKSFDLADKYQMPVIIMGDKLLCESHKSHDKEAFASLFSKYTPNRGKLVRTPTQTPYLRYKVSEDGVSERLVPGFEGAYYQANSYEHIEDSHTTEDAEPRKAQVEKRAKKQAMYLQNDFSLPQVFGDLKTASIVFVSWGGNKGTILEAQRQLAAANVQAAYIHFTHLYPMDREKVRQLFASDKRFVLIENNSHAQFGRLLALETGVEIKEKLLKYDGRPFWAEEITSYATTKA